MSLAVTGAVIVGASGIGAALISANAATNAANAQSHAAQAGINVQQQQLAQQAQEFQQGQANLSPYNQAGQQALQQQEQLMTPQGMQEFQNSPMFQGMLQQGQNSILQNAGATGGLRGGNVQQALSQYSPQLLNQLIQQRFSNLSSISGLGENAAAGQGNLLGQQANLGQQNVNSQAALLGQQGQAQAGGILGQGAAYGGMGNSLLNSLMAYSALSGQFGGGGVNSIPGATGSGNYGGYNYSGAGVNNLPES